MEADLVLDGGGVKGICLVGAISVLHEAGYRFQRVAGVSAGSVVGALVAAGMDGPDMQAVLRDLDYRRFKDRTGLSRVPVMGRGLSLIARNGIYGGNYLRHWLGSLLDDLGVRTFGDLRVQGEGSALPPMKRRYRLVIVAADVSRRSIVHLPWDYPLYGLDPDAQPVIDAVQASSAVPFYYRPVKLRHASGETSLLLDSGILAEPPLDIFNAPDAHSGHPTIGLRFEAAGDSSSRLPVIATPLQFGRALLSTIVTVNRTSGVRTRSSPANTVFLNASGLSAVDFHLDRTAQELLYAEGRTAATSVLANLAPLERAAAF